MSAFTLKYELAKEFTKIAKSEQRVSELMELQIPVMMPEMSIAVEDEPLFFV
jgi:hypothetical protein